MAQTLFSKKYQNTQLGLEIVKLCEAYRDALKDAGAVATGKLSEFQYQIHTKNQHLLVTINLQWYWKIIEEGVNGWQTNQGSPYSFKTKIPGEKMVNAIEKWIQIKKILPRDKKGRFIPRRNAAFAFSKSILKKGLKPKHILRNVLNKNRAIKKDITAILKADIISYVKEMTNEFYR